MSGWQVSPDRRWSLGALVLVVMAGCAVVFIAMWYVGATSGLILGAGPDGEGCRTFWDEAPRDVAWSPNGAFLVVTTHDASGDDRGDPGVRVYRWPGMTLVSRASAFGEPFTIDDLGVVRWHAATSTVPVETIAWRMEPGHEPVADVSDAPPKAASSQTRPGVAISSGGVAARVLVPDDDGPVQLCLESPPSA